MAEALRQSNVMAKRSGRDTQAPSGSKVELSTAFRNSRARPGRDATVVERVAWCRHLMSSWEWHGTPTRRELAEAWGVSPETIKGYSSEAHRSLKLDPEELEVERIAHASNAERIMWDAYSRCSEVTGLPDYGNALKANEQAAAFKGLELKSKVELTGKNGGPLALIDVSKLSDAELNEYLTGTSFAAVIGEGGTRETPALEGERPDGVCAEGDAEVDAPGASEPVRSAD